MCKKATLRLSLTCLNGFALASGFVCLGLGVWLIIEGDFAIAYGNTVKNWGGSLLFCALCCFLVVYFGMYGTFRHNKFALSVAIAADLFVVMVLGFTAIAIFVGVAPTHSADFVATCLERPPTAEWGQLSAECQDYFFALPNIKLFRLWTTLFVRSETEATVKALLVNLENDNFCCGWGPPYNCLNDATVTGPFPLNGEDLLQSDQPTREAMARCTRDAGWYAESTFCQDVVGGVSGTGQDFGCPYIFPTNSLCTTDNGRSGCALVFQERLAGQLTGVAAGCIVLMFLQLLTVLASCCYCLKRKGTDVLPPFKPFVDKRFEKYRYGVPNHTDPMEIEVSSDEEDGEADDSKDKAGTDALKPMKPGADDEGAAGAVETKASPGEAKAEVGEAKAGGVGLSWA